MAFFFLPITGDKIRDWQEVPQYPGPLSSGRPGGLVIAPTLKPAEAGHANFEKVKGGLDSPKVTTATGTATLTIAVAAATHGLGRGSTERFTSGAGPQPTGRHLGASGQQHIRLTQRFRRS